MKPKITVIVPVYNQEDLLTRALDSIPLDKDVQIVLVDDGSTDRTWDVALDWWRSHNVSNSSVIHRWEPNKGVAAALNLGYSLALGEYIVNLSSDDYFLKDFSEIRQFLDGENDLVYFNIEVEDGSVWPINAETKKLYVGGVKFMRRAFIGDTKLPDKKWHEDVDFARALQAKEPKEVFTGITFKHYTWPRVGSLTWQATHKDAK